MALVIMAEICVNEPYTSSLKTKLISVIDGWSKIDFQSMSLDLTDDKSTLFQVMAWCHQATSYTWANIDPDLCRY